MKIDFKKWHRNEQNELYIALMDLVDNIHPLRRSGDFTKRFKTLKNLLEKIEKEKL